jgi:hypothetical protein
MYDYATFWSEVLGVTRLRPKEHAFTETALASKYVKQRQLDRFMSVGFELKLLTSSHSKVVCFALAISNPVRSLKRSGRIY